MFHFRMTIRRSERWFVTVIPLFPGHRVPRAPDGKESQLRGLAHTPVKGTSSLKSLRKRSLPSLPAKPEWRAKVMPGEEMAGHWDCPAPSHPSRSYASSKGVAALLLAIPRVN